MSEVLKFLFISAGWLIGVVTLFMNTIGTIEYASGVIILLLVAILTILEQENE